MYFDVQKYVVMILFVWHCLYVNIYQHLCASEHVPTTVSIWTCTCINTCVRVNWTCTNTWVRVKMYQHLCACEHVKTPWSVWTCTNTCVRVNMYGTSICVRVNIVLTSVNMWTHTNSCLCEHVWWVHVRWVAVRVLLSTSTSSCGTSTTKFEYI